MKPGAKPTLIWLITLSLTLLACSTEADERLYFAIETDGVVWGYSEIELSTLERDGRELILLEQYAFTKASALGSEFDSEVELTYHIDPETWQFTYHSSDVHQGQMDLWSRVFIGGNRARFVSNLSDTTVVVLPQGVILENTLINPHLVRDFVESDLSEKTYDILEVREWAVQKTTYTRVGIDSLELAGTRYRALILDGMKEQTGIKYRVWIDTATGYTLKTRISNRMIYRSDPSVKKRVTTATFDEQIFSPANVTIADIGAITYMKVRARVEPSGLRLTADALNVPGQTFAGTVEANLVDGVFEIEHPHFDGAGAPPFPPDYSGDSDLAEFLGPGPFIEADDPVLKARAEELTAGSADSWEAACRLADWVAENIGYAIPGGGTARKTYDIRAGECGAHSFLTASFCRAVGIPARVVWGCMYVPKDRGVFGQHAWNEIYMGEAGWIPLDVTVMQTRFVDSGHIRLGIYQSLSTALNPKEFEVLDYRLGSGEAIDSTALRNRHDPYVGTYGHSEGGPELKVFTKDGSLTITIAGKTTLAFADPDTSGRWVCRMTDRVYLIFVREDDGPATDVDLHEIVMLPRTSDLGQDGDEAPGHLQPYLGNYLFPQAQADFRILYSQGGLALYEPLSNRTILLQPDEGAPPDWVDQHGELRISFDMEGDSVVAMRINDRTRFNRR
jgi:transglutaminase-like putative cysteine protease